MKPFRDKIESVVNNEVTISTTVRVATYELYLDWLYDTITCVGSFDDAYAPFPSPHLVANVRRTVSKHHGNEQIIFISDSTWKSPACRE